MRTILKKDADGLPKRCGRFYQKMRTIFLTAFTKFQNLNNQLFIKTKKAQKIWLGTGFRALLINVSQKL